MTYSPLEQRVASHLTVVADSVPGIPPQSFAAAQARRVRRHRGRRIGTGLGLVIALGAGGVGVGAAAAAGGFSRPATSVGPATGGSSSPGASVGAATPAVGFSIPVAPVFRQFDKEISTPPQPGAELRMMTATAEAAGQPLPALLPTTPATIPVSFTFGPQIFHVTEPGPDGTTINVYSQRTGRQSGCIVAMESTAGLSPMPGTGVPVQDRDHVGGCSGVHGTPGTTVVPIPPGEGNGTSSSYMYGEAGGVWVAPDGVWYQLVVGELSPTATQVVLTLGDGATYQVPAVGGFFAIGLSEADFSSGGTITNYSASGSVLSVYPLL